MPSFGVPPAAQPAPIAGPAEDVDLGFQELRTRAALVQKELPPLEQALAALAAELRTPAAAPNGSEVLAQVEEAREIVRSHDEDIARFAFYTGMVRHWRDAGHEIEILAELLKAEGDRVLRVIAERPARADAGPDALVTAHTAYRKAMTELVDAARHMREQMRVLGERESLAGDGSGGRDDPRFRRLLAQFGEAFATAAVYLPSTPPELFRPRERPADPALDVALLWDDVAGEWHRLPGSVPAEAYFRDAYIALGRRPTPGQLKALATNYAQIELRRTLADEFARFLAGAAGDAVLAKAIAQSDGDGSVRRALAEPWRFRINDTYDDDFHERTLRFLGRLRQALADESASGAAERRLDDIAGRFKLTLAGRPADSILPATGAVRVVSWPSGRRNETSTSTWRFDRDRVTIEFDGRQVTGKRQGNVVTSEAPTTRQQHCRVKDIRTFAEGGTLEFTAMHTCTRRKAGTRVRDVSGAGTWELLRQPGSAADPERGPPRRGFGARDPS